MPRENKKRGRRMTDKKRKHEDDLDGLEEETVSKRRRSVDQEQADNGVLAEDAAPAAAQPERPFFGLLDDEEQSFFHNADATLQADTFASDDDKQAFLSSVYKEAEGKELKLANSQSCSRLLERLIMQSTPEQCKNLFEKFAGNYSHLMTHRFASHCCETLFQRAAPFISHESKSQRKARDADINATPCTLADYLMQVVAEIKKDAGYLVTDPYASHGLRVLMAVLAGETPASQTQKNKQQQQPDALSSGVHGLPNSSATESTTRAVPESFSTAIQDFIAGVAAGLNTDQLRTLARHPNASPTIQLLLRLELSTFGKQRANDDRSIIRLLLPGETITAESESITFLNGMVYDPVGSHLVETVVQAAPGKLFKSLYKAMLFERLPSYARNEIASHITCRVLERLGHDDLLEVHEAMIPIVSDLLRRNRTNVVRTLIERCTVRNIDTKAIAVQVNGTWSTPEGFEIQKLLKTALPATQVKTDASQTSREAHSDQVLPDEEPVTPKVKAHFNVLAQAMLLVPGPLSALVLDSLVSLESTALLAMSYDSIVSRTLQAALTTRSTSIITTRKLVQHFYGHIGEMSLDQSASRVVDCIWEGTHGLAFIRERIAEELAENESQLRESPIGRAVWRNWKMDIYKRRRGEWIRQSKVKAGNDGFQSFSELDSIGPGSNTPKTPLQLARERHAREKKEKEKTEAGEKESSKKEADLHKNASSSKGREKAAKKGSGIKNLIEGV